MNIKDLFIPLKPATFALKVLPLLILVIAVFNSYFIVTEGHVGVVKRFGEAKHQENPGLHFKIPFTAFIR